jgi:hypothetical protein
MVKLLLVACILLVGFAGEAYAYIDPGKGSGLQQLLAKLASGLAVLLSSIGNLFGKRRKKEGPSGNPEEAPADDGSKEAGK